MQAWLEQVEQAGLAPWPLLRPRLPQRARQLRRGALRKNTMFPARSRSQKGILVFLARDAQQGVLRYANAGVIKMSNPMRFSSSSGFGRSTPVHCPPSWCFDSQLTTYEKLSEFEPGRDLLHHPATAFPQDAAADLQSTGFGLAADQFAGSDPAFIATPKSWKSV